MENNKETKVATSPTFLLTAKQYYLVTRNKETGEETRILIGKVEGEKYVG